MKKYYILLSLLFLLFSDAFSQQQIDIPRIEQMPNQPDPYLMRNWKQAALNYDAFVFDGNLTGEYLPLMWRVNNTVNYPSQSSFGLATVVGTTRPRSAEAINVMPAVISASLVGVDKSNQDGANWVAMCQEYFNNRPEENVYLNHPVTSSGNDWWYDTMPNLFFYQLFDLYPGTGDFERQFRLVADRWLEAVDRMGGGTTPWAVPRMNYRAWSLSQMKPLRTGVPEPEAAGAIAWLLYNAYTRTGDLRYRIGAEWAMEFLTSLNDNPSYELQLSYGVYAAARMNAELGTDYDVQKMLNWCFDRGPLRSWGAIVGRWRDYDVSGLIGEVSSNDYAFIMNGFEQAGALTPLVRYDERFSRAIGKWMLNLANASRLFYPGFLPRQKQDSDHWSAVHDTNAVIAHEALREEKWGYSPYATGDAISGGWGETNLALYASSHVGILGGIVDTTNVPKILKLDLLKTDYFHKDAYPTWLFYNPYDSEKSITLDIPDSFSAVDVYESLSNAFIENGVTTNVTIKIPADAAALIVLVPSGGVLRYELNKMLVDDVVVDYDVGQTIANYPPRIKAVAAANGGAVGETINLYCKAEDRETEILDLRWFGQNGESIGSGEIIQWQPDQAGSFFITVTATDEADAVVSDSLEIIISNNRAPRINSINASPDILMPGETTTLTCTAVDEDGDFLNFTWQSNDGVLSGRGRKLSWQAPQQFGLYSILCTVSDSAGARHTDSVAVVVGDLIADYRFDGTTDDVSGFENHGESIGATFADDRLGSTNSALSLNGVNQFVHIRNHLTLNAGRGISINLWLKIYEQPAGEEYLISHGSWQNRHKISLLSGGIIRWTVNTTSGITDLDSDSELTPGQWTNLCANFGDGKMEIYLNGEVSSSKAMAGDLLPTSIDLLIGQMLPGEMQYMFKGGIDDLKIFNRALSSIEVKNYYQFGTGVERKLDQIELESLALSPYPNPFNNQIAIPLPGTKILSIKIYNSTGQEIRDLSDKAGQKKITWDGMQTFGLPASSGLYFIMIKTTNHQTVQKVMYLR
jgi:hypothetical protein